MKINLWDRRLLTGLLAGVGIIIIIFYTYCDTACRYLQGGIWGLDLKYVGLLFMAALILLVLLKKDLLILGLLSLGIGSEVFLFGYQVKNSTYCPFCLAFGVVLVLIFALNFQRKRLPLIIIMAIIGLLFLILAFAGSVTPAFAEENFITSFGSGRVNVRLYTDYFCAPCRAAEPEIETLLTNLLEKNAIRLTLIDTPVHRETTLYARYFLYMLNDNRRLFAQAMQARDALFEAATLNIKTAKAMEAYLAKKNLTFQPFDPSPIFRALEGYIKEDGINSTPSCVIYGAKGKEVLVGKVKIVNGLKGIREKQLNLSSEKGRWMKEVDKLITGGTILTMDKDDQKIDAGALAIDGDTIVAIGRAEELTKQFQGRSLIDTADSIIMPGLVNGHTHAAMTCFRGIADDLELMVWLNDYIFPAEAKNVDPELAYWGTLLAAAEMIKSGTTTFCDMYIFEEEAARAAKQAGIRCLLGEVLFDFPSPNFQTPAEGFAYTRKLIEKWADDPLINIVVEPHSLYTCSPALLSGAKSIADAYQLPYATHLLENQAEQVRLYHLYGKKPLLFLKDIGYLTEDFLAFHCVCLDEEDIKLFADHGCRAVHAPESNMKLASGVAPVPALRKAGITVGLGTDGCASNNNLDMFQAMDAAAKLHKVMSLDPTVMDARTVIRMATCEGARALGLDDITGSLELGKKADIAIIDCNKPHLTPMYNEYSHLVYAAAGADVDTVLINGQVVMRNRQLLTINESEVMARVREIALRIKESLP